MAELNIGQEVKYMDKALRAKIVELRGLVWGEDIASPTCPEYIEHHDSIQKIMHFIDNELLSEEKSYESNNTK